jgi:hypothetical protein
MTADDPRYTLPQAADLTDKSIDTLRRWVKNGKLPGAGSDADDPGGTTYIPAAALIAPACSPPSSWPTASPRRCSPAARPSGSARPTTTRWSPCAQKAMLHRENQLLRDRLLHAQKLASNIVAGFGKGRAA